MSLLSTRPALRWALPAGVVALAAAVVGGSIVAANADPALPPRTAAQLLVDVQGADVQAFSGTVVQKADLGLPALPNIGGQGSSSLTSLVAGTNTLKVWYDGPTRNRLALLGTLGETDVIHNGRDVWLWSSQENSASHYVLPEGEAGKAGRPAPAELPKTPQEAADMALSAIDPSTTVTTDGTATVAGRSAYELVLAPKNTGSKIASVRLAIDAEKKIPLRVRVYARAATEPAIEVGFTHLSLTRPGAEHFRFTPPPGVKVEDGTLDADAAPKPHGKQDDKPGAKPGARDDGPGPDTTPTVVGDGWASVVVVKGFTPPTPDAETPEQAEEGLGQLAGVLERLPAVKGAWGSGRLLESTLFSVLLTDDGRALIGAVDPEQLYAAAAKAPR